MARATKFGGWHRCEDANKVIRLLAPLKFPVDIEPSAFKNLNKLMSSVVELIIG